MAILLLRLAGPMQSWGIQSRFTNRDTALEPSKSGVIGLLCAALGKPRDEGLLPSSGHHGWPSLADLASLKMGIRVDYPGTVERDYHTAGGSHLKKDSEYGVPTADGKSRRTVTSDRFYLADAIFLVALQGDRKILERLYNALQHPVWPLYLGRKAFVPGCPVWLKDGFYPDENGLKKALTSYPYLCPDRSNIPDTLRLELEADAQGDRAKPDQPECFVSAERRFGLRYTTTSQIERIKLPVAKEELCIFPS
ncbi:MAG: type I-E CRISPR-associated protein Cas5/CasD [Chloroflexi bacterium]|nr:type I-E CRISPR-associated protein Cas5/CasD [Chloroflexota bacterium]